MIETIKLREDFRAFHKVSAFHVSKNLVYKFIACGSVIKFGIVISRKVGNAVQRNLLRRRLKYIFRSILMEKSIKRGLYLLICRERIKLSSFQDLSNEINKTFSRRCC